MSRRPRILIGALSCKEATGGAALSAMAAVDLIPADYDVTVLTGSNDTSRLNVHELRIGGVRAAVPLLLRIPTGLLGLRRQVRQVLDTVRPDLIHLQDAGLLDPVIPLARKTGIPVVVTLRDLLFVPTSWGHSFDVNGFPRPPWQARGAAFLGLVERGRVLSWALPLLLPLLYAKPAQQRRLLKKAELLLPVSDYVMAELTNCNISAPMKVMRLEPVPEWPASPPRAGSGVRFLAVGRLVEGKGFDVLLRAFSRVVACLEDATLAIVGLGPQSRKLRALAVSLGCESRVRFHGYVPLENLPCLFRDSDIVVVPSTAPEATGRVALEAGMAGRPVIAARSGGLVETVGDRGILVPPGAAEPLARAMVVLGADRELQARLAADARREALRYTPERLRAELVALYEHVLAGGSESGWVT